MENGTYTAGNAFKYKNLAEYLQNEKSCTSWCEKKKKSETVSDAAYDVHGDIKDGSFSGDDISIEEPKEKEVIHVGSSEGAVDKGDNMDRVYKEQRISKSFLRMKENFEEGNRIAVLLINAKFCALVLSITPGTTPKYTGLLNLLA